MPLQSPLPTSLPKECAKAAQIFSSFSSIIPNELLRDAKGFAILVIAKAGFLFSARAGSGVVIVRLPDGSWSAPSAIGTGGLGVGGQAGAELSEFVIILNSRAAVQSFMSAGSVNLGGNLSVAVGPVGRNAEATGSINKLATMYSYSRTKGLFGGASLEGSVIFERSDTNEKAYSNTSAWNDDDPYDDDYRGGRAAKVSARSILSGQIRPPPWASTLIAAIERRTGSSIDQNWIDDAEDADYRRNRGYSFSSEQASRSSDHSPQQSRKATSPRDQLAASAKGRLRGYSLGSFGRSKGAGDSDNYPSSRQRERSNTSASNGPAYRYHRDSDEEDGGRNPYRDVDDLDNIFENPDVSYAERERAKDRAAGFDERDYDVPPSPSSTNSTKSQRFSDFMKRPVMPTRKSTSSITGKGNGRSSPLSGRSRSASVRAKSTLSRFGYGGNDDDDDSGRRSGRASPGEYPSGLTGRDGEFRQTGTESPFADQFSNEPAQTFDFDRFRSAGSTEGSRSSSPTTQKSSFMSSTKSKKSSLLGTAASALSRPLGRRSTTAPLPRRNQSDGRGGRGFGEDDDEDPYGQSDRYGGRGDEEAFDWSSAAARRSGEESLDRSGWREARQSSDDEDTEPEQIQIHRNPFEEGGNGADAGSASRNTHSSARRLPPPAHRDLLSALDEDHEAIMSSSFSSVEVPRHRLDALYLKEDNHETRSIRSIDSNTEFTFGDKAHKIKVVTNDLSGVGSPTKSPVGGKQYRMATFDFEGTESGDLPFSTGEIIEVLSMDDPDWYIGRIGNRQGIIPVNRTRPYRG